MLLLRLLAVAGCFALSGLCVQAQEDDLKAFLRKAIKAHGGEENLAKYKAFTVKFKGTMDLMGMKAPIEGETSLQKPDKLKTSVEIDFNGKKIPIVQVYDGKTFWVSALGKTQEIKDDKILNEMRESLTVEGAGMTEFVKAPYELSSLGEVMVKGKAALGIRVSKKGQRDLSLFFDKKTHLMVKIERRAYDSMNKEEVTQEKFMSDFQDVNGTKMPRHIEVVNDGKQFMEMEISDTKVYEKLDPSMFAMP
jgi:outer membrane lipoprotein-sorting protein